MGICVGQEAPADGKGEGSEDKGDKVDKETKGVKDDKGEGNKGDDGHFSERGGRQWTQQLTRC